MKTETIYLLIRIFIIILVSYVIGRLIKRVLDRHQKESDDKNKVQILFLKRFFIGSVYVFGIGFIIYSIPTLRSFAVSIFASAGVMAIVIGFAAQQTFSNFIAGIFIILFKPFKIGDRVKMGTTLSGVVEDITLRHTIIRSFENKRFIIPNTTISNEIVENSNYGDEKICKYIDFTISYESDIKKAKKIMKENAEKHPLSFDNRSVKEKKAGEPKVSVKLLEYLDSGIRLRAWVWTKNPSDAFTLGCDLNESIKERFDKEGIEIPYPHMTINYKKEKISKRK